MIFVPFKRVVMETPLSPSGIVDRLTPRVYAKHYCWLSNLMGKFDFVGRVTPTKINLLPVINWNDPYLPQFKGKIFSTNSGGRLEIVIMPSIANILICLLVMIIPPLLFKDVYDGCTWVGFFIFIHIVGCLIGFDPVVDKFEIKLRNLLDAK